ncbi:MAG: MetQ/NlpA family ABC transporter substrate-binding protein [Clostridia bacterium]|nr:MetQ/NlpA family ABC transporter substrate-binding protein [Clostridia bacterium]
MKKLLVSLLVLSLVVSLAGAALANTPVKIGATPTPHAEVLNFVVPLLAEKGFDLTVVEFNDYIRPNVETQDGEVDANYFQHKPYLNNFNEQNGTTLVAVIPVHFEPMGIYPGRTASLDAIQEGAKIAVPNDPTNCARALLLLEAQGLIKIAEDAGLTATKLDIVDNPFNIDILEIEAAQVPRALADVDFAVINGNYALAVGLSASKDAVAAEGLDSEAAQTRINYVVVEEGNEDADFVAALREVLNSDEVRAFIEETYQGAVVPAF